MRLAVLFLTLAWLASPAAADQAVRLDLGFASPIGFGGLIYAAEAGPLVLEAGVGAGGTGLQLSAMPKLAVPWRDGRWLFGAGVSLGAGSSHGEVVWLNLDLVGFEGWLWENMSWFAGGGLTFALSGSCDDVCGMMESWVLPQARAGVGFWF